MKRFKLFASKKKHSKKKHIKEKHSKKKHIVTTYHLIDTDSSHMSLEAEGSDRWIILDSDDIINNLKEQKRARKSPSYEAQPSTE